ncbi:hypothetical protein Nepgr_028113 [Nepenthes gracilis]|uniref:Uncharacterized protein n=1 Tax=Nepenthes gracilis TaxID=150966 RepID=A0AAD3T9P2_NEPGR|nr:hypothetical protein Nepgr_028113 [Nepenthes gracilis]
MIAQSTDLAIAIEELLGAEATLKLADAWSIYLLNCLMPFEDSLNWVCDYPEGDIHLSTDEWINRNYDYFEFLTPDMRNTPLQLKVIVISILASIAIVRRIVMATSVLRAAAKQEATTDGSRKPDASIANNSYLSVSDLLNYINLSSADHERNSAAASEEKEIDEYVQATDEASLLLSVLSLILRKSTGFASLLRTPQDLQFINCSILRNLIDSALV